MPMIESYCDLNELESIKCTVKEMVEEIKRSLPPARMAVGQCPSTQTPSYMGGY